MVHISRHIGSLYSVSQVLTECKYTMPEELGGRWSGTSLDMKTLSEHFLDWLTARW